MWGGRKIQSILGKALPAGKMIGESWEIYDFPPGVVDKSGGWVSSEVAAGPLAGQTLHQLVEKLGKDLTGNAKLVGSAGQFPLLIKYLDAKDDLSVQVHPDEIYAAKNPGAHLKSEAWYVVQADNGSRILKGLSADSSPETFKSAINQGNVEAQIRAIPVKPGECFYLPSGTVHALGAGILAAEVQTPSDTTFRVFDFDRVDPTTGTKRTLHVDQALACINFTEPAPTDVPAGGNPHQFFPTASRLVTSEYFTIDKIRCARGTHRPISYNEAVIWMMLEGDGQIAADGVSEPTSFVRGDTLLLPAAMKQPVLQTTQDCIWLEITLPQR